MAFAARDFSPRRGASDEHIPQWICEERATKSGRKRPAALRVAPNLACGFVARRSQPHGRGMLPPRASPQAKLGATNVIGFMPQTTKLMCVDHGYEIKALALAPSRFGQETLVLREQNTADSARTVQHLTVAQ